MHVSANGTVTPNAAPTDNGTVSTVTASAPSFTGTLTGNATTGVITVQTAGPGGSYTVTVTATDNCGTTTTTTFQLVVNAIPVANPDSLVRQKNAAAKIAVSQVLANDTDADSDSLTVTGVNSPSPNGATVTLEGTWIIYQPPAGFNSPDSFTYSISDGRGGTATGTVNVTVTPQGEEQTKNIVSITPSGADMIVRVAGIAGRVYRFETTSSLTSPITWTPHPAGPQTAGADGIVQLTDPAPPSPRFYRAVEN
jgi:Cadherin-like domain